MDSEIARIYGNKVRLRVCGLLWNEDRLLMVKHRLGNQDFWSPPGGGVEFGEPVETALKREIQEETGLGIIPKTFLFGCEFLKAPLHAVELFFEVVKDSGTLTNGYDPEIQLIHSVEFLTPYEIQNIPEDLRHGIFNKFKDVSVLRQINGFYSI